jgi:hypothetical protein
MKHTPGPWTQWADTNIIIGLHSGSKRIENLRICEVATHTWQDQGRYNARLIAAAPETAAERDRLREVNVELLEALVTLLDSVEGKRITQGDCNQARAAIAKATGDAA